jgi:serine phosphatase RsbU (regulator of sigma subunit)
MSDTVHSLRILFVGLPLATTLRRTLLANGFIARNEKSFRIEEDYDLVVFAPKTPSQLSELKAVRARLPDAWITVLVDREWLAKTERFHELLNCVEKNEIQWKDRWEKTYWFSIQSAARHRQTQLQLNHLIAERRGFRRQYDALHLHSESLVKQLERDVNLASSLQRSILPKVSPEIPGISIAAKYVPAPGIGGDYYDIFEFGDRRRFGVLLADSKTHGMAAALLSVLLKVRLEEMKDRFPDSKTFVEFIHQEIQSAHSKDIAPMSLLYAILDRTSLTLQYTTAGSLKPLLWRESAAVDLNSPSNPILGGTDHTGFREATVRLRPGDLLIFHTDGLEAPIGRGHSSAQSKILDLLKRAHPFAHPLELQNELMALIDEYVEKNALKDDLTVLHLAIDERAMYLAPQKLLSKS